MLELSGIIEGIADADPGRECLVWRDQRRSWREVVDRTWRVASLLHERGIGRDGAAGAEAWTCPNDRVALYLLNSPDYVEAFLAAHRARASAFNVNHRYVDRELAYLFDDARPSAVVFHGRFAETIAGVRSHLAEDVLLVQVDDETHHPLLPGAVAYEEVATSGPALPPPVRPDGTDMHLLYTGGTTGMPKGVLWSIDDWLAGPIGVRAPDGTPARTIGDAVDAALAQRGCSLPVPPLMHGSGTWFAISGLTQGRTVAIQDVVTRFDPHDVLDTCERERVTAMMIIGDAFAAPLVDAFDARPRDLSSLRVVLSSGAILRNELKDALRARIPGLRLLDVVGASESGGQASGTGDGAFELAGHAVVLAPGLDRVLGDGETGEGWLASSGRIPRGYFGDAEKTAATFRVVEGDRYVVPGDRVHLDGGRRVRFLGRDSTTINTGGEKVFAEEIEQVVRSIAGVRDAVVVGRPSERWGSEVVALVEIDGEIAPTDDDLRAACRADLAGYKVPKDFVRVDKVGRLATGKVDLEWARSAATG